MKRYEVKYEGTYDILTYKVVANDGIIVKGGKTRHEKVPRSCRLSGKFQMWTTANVENDVFDDPKLEANIRNNIEDKYHFEAIRDTLKIISIDYKEILYGFTEIEDWPTELPMDVLQKKAREETPDG